ncbi:MAG: BtpA/SgcQ family protein [Pyrodictiaceae archaeon]
MPIVRRLLEFKEKPIIAVLHLPPLPGSPLYKYYWGEKDPLHIVDEAVNAARLLDEEGVDAIIIENYGDKPYTIRVKNPAILSMIAIITHSIVKETNLAVGINILRNSGPEAYLVAYSSGASFIRVNSYCETRVAPEGILEPVGREVEELRSNYPLGIKVLADIDVKHSSPLACNYDLKRVIDDCIERFKPDALIVTGTRTGSAPQPGYVAIFKSSGKPILVGSGVTSENIGAYWDIADGFIIGTFFKKSRESFLELDRIKIRRFMEKVKRLRKKTL